MSQSSAAGQRFAIIVRSLLEQNGFENIQEGRGADYRAEAQGQIWAVEAKYYRTAIAQFSLIEAAAAQLLAAGAQMGAHHVMLALSASIPSDARGALENQYGVAVADREVLLAWAARVPRLYDALNAVLEDELTDEPRQQRRGVLDVIGAPPTPTARPAIPTKGADLCGELLRLKRGRRKWREYEQFCYRAFQFLFDSDLSGWHEQKRTEDGLNRFDYICRILPKSAFWQFLIQHLDSRYVVFEFKNYTGLVKQGQVLTTEKYLFEKGLRRVCILVTRAGAHKTAKEMICGAMREHGKLIVVIDDDQLCNMLHMKDRGDDPADRLFELTDEFLMGLSR
jgi:hypothetical protein